MTVVQYESYDMTTHAQVSCHHAHHSYNGILYSTKQNTEN